MKHFATIPKPELANSMDEEEQVPPTSDLRNLLKTGTIVHGDKKYHRFIERA